MTDTLTTAQDVIDNSLIRAMDMDKTRCKDPQALIFLNKAYDYIHKLLIQNNSSLNTVTKQIPMSANIQEYLLSEYLPDFWCMAEEGVYFAADPLSPISIQEKVRAGLKTTDVAPECYYASPTHFGVVSIQTDVSVAAFPTINCRYYPKNEKLTLLSPMPWKGLFDEPMSMFLSNMAQMKAQKPVAEITALYNALESEALALEAKRVPI